MCACCCLVYCDCYGRRSARVKPMDFPSFAFLFYSFYLFFLMLFFLYLFSIQIKHQNFAGESAHYFAHTDCGFIKTEEGINKGNGECKWGIQCFDRPSIGVCVIYGIASEEEHQQFNSRPPSIIASYYAVLWVVALLNLLWCLLQVWQDSPGQATAWNVLSRVTRFGMLLLEVSVLVFHCS